MFCLNFNLEHFKKNYLFKKPVHLKKAFDPPVASLKEFYQILFNPQYDSARSNTDNYPSLVKVRNATKVVTPEIWGHRLDNENSYYRDINALKKAISLKCSVVFDQYYRYSKQTAELVAFFQNQFHCVAGCNAYLSQKEGTAFPIHCDAHHVLIFALTGQKRWKIYNKQQDMIQAYYEVDSTSSDKEIIEEGLALDVVMDPGDLLYIPIGQFHNVENLTNNSLHLTISMSFRPMLSIIEDTFKAIYTSQNLSLSEESRRITNTVHPLYNEKQPLDKKNLSKALDQIFIVLKEVIGQDNFVESQNKIPTNELLVLCHTPTDQFVEEFINCLK